MKIRSFAVLLFLAAALSLGIAGEPVRLLTVGNSFADNAMVYFPEFARAGGKDLVYAKANLGGHSLEQHAAYLKAYEANPNDPKGSPYKSPADPSKKTSLKEILASQPWTIVTIQQVSTKSFDSGSYEPFAGILVNYIRENAPAAEILIHETWAYREDCPLFKDGTLTQKKMYEQLRAAYDKLSRRYGFRLIPSGDAFQLARRTPRWTFSFPDSSFDYANPPSGRLPNQTGSLNVGWNWSKKGGKETLKLDFKHANPYGEYLIGAVWYEVVFRDDVRNNSFVPKGISAEDAAALRQLAHEAVAARYPDLAKATAPAAK